MVRTVIGSRKCGCLFKLRAKPVVGGEGWKTKLMCGSHNHALAKSLIGHPYVDRLTNVGSSCLRIIKKGRLN